MCDMSKKELEQLFALTDKLYNKTHQPRGLTAALFFNMPSTRTLVSFEAALEQMGVASSHLNYVFTQMVRGEAMEDTAKALSQYVSIIIARLSDHKLLEKLAQNSDVPVINAATPLEHPCQALADLYTINKKKKLKKGAKLFLIGEPTSNVANSLLLASSLFGISCTFLTPKGYMPLKNYLEKAKKNTEVNISHDLGSVKDADVIYSTGWVREIPEQESPMHLKAFTPYQIDTELLKKAPSDVLIMHPLPAFRGLEIASEVLDDKNSIVWEQTKNRLYTQKALLSTLLKI